MIYSRIVGTGSYLPEKVLTNADLEKLVETTDEWILQRTGIRERHYAAESEATSELAYKASMKALKMAGIRDILAKSLGSSNPYNMVRATFDALKRQDSPRLVAARRNIKVSALQSRRREAGEGEQAVE